MEISIFSWQDGVIELNCFHKCGCYSTIITRPQLITKSFVEGCGTPHGTTFKKELSALLYIRYVIKRKGSNDSIS